MFKRLFTTLVILAIASSLTADAAVTHWRVIKGAYYEQSQDNSTNNATASWGIYGVVETDLPGDATSIVIEGGNIAGSIAYELEGTEWELGADFTNKTALDAVFPAGNYSIILSGGTLGTVTQQFTIGEDAYPNVPYLTGADYSDCLALEALEPFELNWSDAGSTTAISLEIFTGSELDEGDDVYAVYTNVATGAVLPWNVFEANSNYNGFIDFGNAELQSGIGGFGLEGDVSFNTALAFYINTVNSAVDYDDFDGGTNSSWVSFLTEPGKQFTPFNDVLEFTSGNGPDNDSVAWVYDTDALSYTQDWAVAVDIANFIDPAGLSGGQDAYFTLVIGSDDLQNLMLLENFIEESYNEVFVGVDSNGVESVVEYGVEIDQERVSLKVSFDAEREILTSAYSLGGNYIVLTNFSTKTWGISDSEEFLAALSFGSDNLAISSGEVYADNFRIYGEEVVSNHIEEIEISYLRVFNTPETVDDDYNEYNIIATTDQRVQSVSFTLPDDQTIVINEMVDDGEKRSFDFESTDPIEEPFDPVVDGDWTITVGYIDGTFQSTVVPYTKEDGVTAIPLISNQPLFTAINRTGDEVTFEWAVVDPSANFVAVERWDEETDDLDEVGFFATSITDEIGAIESIDGPLSTTMTSPYTAPQGTQEFLFINGWGRTAYNDDGVAYALGKSSESAYYIYIPAAGDEDADMMDDAWEIEFFGGTNVVNGGTDEDFDMDGMSNFSEFIAGVNPTNSGSVFGVEEAEPIPAGYVVNWTAVAGREYGVYWTTDIVSGFEPLATGLSYPVNSYTDTVHTVEQGGFYYIDVQLAD